MFEGFMKQKLFEADHVKIKKLFANGVERDALAERFGVTKQTIMDILKERYKKKKSK